MVHVTPRSGRDAVSGVVKTDAGLEIRVRVSVAPEGGRANKVVCELVARSLHLPKSAVSVASGATARRKRLSIACEESQVADWVASLPRL